VNFSVQVYLDVDQARSIEKYEKIEKYQPEATDLLSSLGTLRQTNRLQYFTFLLEGLPHSLMFFKAHSGSNMYALPLA